MKKYTRLLLLLAVCLGLAACTANQKSTAQQKQPYRKKIYLTEQDYLDDLSKEAYAERREAKPKPESDYVFNVLPETPKNIYFFDERVQPKIPGEPSERDYKNTKRLWEKPRRYSPDQYYGEGGAPASGSGAAEDDAYADYD